MTEYLPMELYALPWDGVMAHPYGEDYQLCGRNVRSLITRQESHDFNRERSQGRGFFYSQIIIFFYKEIFEDDCYF